MRPLSVKVSHEAVMRVVFIGDELSVPALLSYLVACLCHQSLQAFLETLALDDAPSLADSIGKHGPHLFTYFVVRFGQVANLGTIPRIGSIAFLDQAFISLAASVGSFAGELVGNGLPIEALLPCLKESLITLGRPCC